MEFFQIGNELPPKELRHDLDRKEETSFARPPVPSALGQSTSGNDIKEDAIQLK